MAQHTHTLRKKIRKAINEGNDIASSIETLRSIAADKDAPAATRRACAKDLIDIGMSVEKDLEILLAEEKKKRQEAKGKAISEDVDDDSEETKGVVVRLTAE